MTFRRIEEIEAWQRSMALAENIYKVTTSTRFDKDWGLRDQIRRAAVSIPSNIAEGFERNSEADFNRFILIYKGSCGELRTQLMLANRIEYISKEEADILVRECIEISSMLAGLSKFIVSGLQKARR